MHSFAYLQDCLGIKSKNQANKILELIVRHILQVLSWFRVALI